jgi:hypothetical protein
VKESPTLGWHVSTPFNFSRSAVLYIFIFRLVVRALFYRDDTYRSRHVGGVTLYSVCFHPSSPTCSNVLDSSVSVSCQIADPIPQPLEFALGASPYSDALDFVALFWQPPKYHRVLRVHFAFVLLVSIDPSSQALPRGDGCWSRGDRRSSVTQDAGRWCRREPCNRVAPWR